jgi:uncharacterized membrane protein YbhN (UPF0104 family)
VSKLLRLLVSVTLLGWLIWRTDWDQVRQAFAHLRLELWLAALGLYMVAQVASGLRWKILARPLGFTQSLRHFLGFTFIGMYFNLMLPTSVGGDVARAWYLDGGSGRRLVAFLSVFVDRVSGLLVLLALACVAMLFCPVRDLPLWIPCCVWGSAAASVAALAALPVLGRWVRRLDRARRLGEGARLYVGRPRLMAGATLMSIIVQVVNVMIVCLVGRAIGVSVPASYYWVFVPMVTLLTMLPVSLNGMGIREGGMTLFLAPLGIPTGTILSLSFLWFAVYVTASLCGGAVYVFGAFPRPTGAEIRNPNEVLPDHEPVRGDPDQGRTGQRKTAA